MKISRVAFPPIWRDQPTIYDNIRVALFADGCGESNDSDLSPIIRSGIYGTYPTVGVNPYLVSKVIIKAERKSRVMKKRDANQSKLSANRAGGDTCRGGARKQKGYVSSWAYRM